jgi:HEAT repeat protein
MVLALSIAIVSVGLFSCQHKMDCDQVLEIERLLVRIENRATNHQKTSAEWRAIEEMGVSAGPRLIEEIEGNTNPEIRRGALSVLGHIKFKEAFESVQRCAEADPSTNVRVWAISALEEIDQERAFDVVISLIDDPKWEIRRIVALILGKYANRDTCPMLKKLLQDPHGTVRGQAGESLLMRRCSNARLMVEDAIRTESDSRTREQLVVALRIHTAESHKHD